MRQTRPTELVDLLDASEAADIEKAWDAFVRRHSRLIMHAVRQNPPNYDRTMDRYACVLEQLRSDHFRRLRTFRPERGTRLSTWLVVVAQRLCVDFDRRRFGRTGRREGKTSEQAEVRRRLAELIAAQVDLMEVQDESAEDPEAVLVIAQRRKALEEAVRTLSNRDRLLLSLRFEDETSAKQIAAAMGFKTPFHVYRRLKKVLGGLRRTLGEDDFRERYG